jgi:hypothetical protein
MHRTAGGGASIDLLEDGVLRVSGATCLEATLCDTCGGGGGGITVAALAAAQETITKVLGIAPAGFQGLDTMPRVGVIASSHDYSAQRSGMTQLTDGNRNWHYRSGNEADWLCSDLGGSAGCSVTFDMIEGGYAVAQTVFGIKIANQGEYANGELDCKTFKLSHSATNGAWTEAPNSPYTMENTGNGFGTGVIPFQFFDVDLTSGIDARYWKLEILETYSAQNAPSNTGLTEVEFLHRL